MTDALRSAGATPGRVHEIAHIMGVDRPWYEQYATFVSRLARGNLGYSFQRRQPVADVVLPAASFAVHLWNEMWRDSGQDKNAAYDPECLYEQLKKKYLQNRTR